MSLLDLQSEIRFQTARSGGKGGQNVNKVETMVEGRWTPSDSKLITPRQLQIISEKLAHRITRNGELLVKSQSERSQLGNKYKVIALMNSLVQTALIPKKMRIASKIPASSKRKRLEDKKIHSVLKNSRKKNWD